MALSAQESPVASCLASMSGSLDLDTNKGAANNKLASNSISGKNTVTACKQRGKELTPGSKGGEV